MRRRRDHLPVPSRSDRARAFGVFAVGAALAAVAPLAACLGDWELEKKTFVCREPKDCVTGYYCHPVRYVCVPIGTSTRAIDGGGLGLGSDVSRIDASPISDAASLPDLGTDAAAEVDAQTESDAQPSSDAAAPDAEVRGRIGDPCDAVTPCGEGQCVDGVCCASPCAGPCERCDRLPGQCRPVLAGRDPDGDCAGTVDCSTRVFGLRDTSCFAYAPTAGIETCDGNGACVLTGCTLAADLVPISSCGNAECLARGACPANDFVERWDTAAELCAAGQACTSANVAGCCSPEGRCCPAPACDPQSPLCL